MRRDSGRDTETVGERELSEALGLSTAPREVSYTAVVAGVVLVGALATFAIATVASLPRRTPLVEEASVSAVDFSAASESFRRGQFADAQAAFAVLARAHPDNARVRDYLTRLARVDSDAALIARARARLALGAPDEALTISHEVAANSPLFPDAWAIAQKAQDELNHAARVREENEREARAAENARVALERDALVTAASTHTRRAERAVNGVHKRTAKGSKKRP